MNELIPYDPPKLLTEREVRVAGVVSSRRASIRSILRDSIQGTSLSVKGRNGATTVLNLPQNDAEAVLALLLERDEQFLTALNIELEP